MCPRGVLGGERQTAFGGRDKKNLKKVYLAGGEPTYIKDYLEFLNGLFLVNPNCEIIINTNLKKLSDAWKDVIKKFGSIDSLINVAAISLPPNQENEHERFSKTLNVNLNAVFKCCDITSRFMSFGGSILNVSSIGGLQGFPNNPGYVASKGGLRMLTKALAVDFKEKGIRVNCLMPGYIKTDMTKASYDNLKNGNEKLCSLSSTEENRKIRIRFGNVS